MKMKISDIIRKSSDEDMAKIIGSVIMMRADGLSADEALNVEYKNTLRTLQSEMEVDYKQNNADRIRAMSDEELAEFLDKYCYSCELCQYSNEPCVENKCKHGHMKWLQKESWEV